MSTKVVQGDFFIPVKLTSREITRKGVNGLFARYSKMKAALDAFGKDIYEIDELLKVIEAEESENG